MKQNTVRSTSENQRIGETMTLHINEIWNKERRSLITILGHVTRAIFAYGGDKYNGPFCRYI